jgi:hypothetical protein
MDIYNLTYIALKDGPSGAPFHGFNVIGIQGRPLVTLAFDTREEAEVAHKAMEPIVAMAKLITPHVLL